MIVIIVIFIYVLYIHIIYCMYISRETSKQSGVSYDYTEPGHTKPDGLVKNRHGTPFGYSHFLQQHPATHHGPMAPHHGSPALGDAHPQILWTPGAARRCCTFGVEIWRMGCDEPLQSFQPVLAAVSCTHERMVQSAPTKNCSKSLAYRL